MSCAVSLPIPCLGTDKAYCMKDAVTKEPAFFDTKTKVAFVFCTFLAITGLVLLPFLLPIGGVFLGAAVLGSLWIIVRRSKEITSSYDSVLEKLEKLEPAKQLAASITISSALQQELTQVIPAIDAMEENERVTSLHYNCDETATFTLKTAPDLKRGVFVWIRPSSIS